MSLRKLQHFIMVAEHKNLSYAAKQLNIVQPALSQSIKRLEKELGVLLFSRSRKGMELTTEGENFLQHAYGITNQYQQAKESLLAHNENPEGTVSIAITGSAARVLLKPVTHELVKNYPKIQMNIETGLAKNIQDGFNAGDYDLVITHLEQTGSNINVVPLIQEDLFYATKYTDSTPNQGVSIEDLFELPLILPRRRHGVAPVLQSLKDSYRSKIKIAQVRGGLVTTLQLIEWGFGASLLPWSSIYKLVEQKKISARRIKESDFVHIVSIVSPANRPIAPATKVVMDLVSTAAREAHENNHWLGKLLI